MVTTLLIVSSLSPAFGVARAAADKSAVTGAPLNLDLARITPSAGGISSASPGIGAFATDNASFDNLGVNTTITLPASANLNDGQSYMMGIFDYVNSTALAGVGIGVTCVYIIGCTTEAAPVAVMPNGSLEYSTSQILTMGDTYTLSMSHYRGYWWNFTYDGSALGTNGTFNLGVARAQGISNQGGVPVGPVFVCAVSLDTSITTTYPPIPTTTIPWAMGVKLHGSSGSGTTSYVPLTANALPQLNATDETVNIQGHDQVASLHNNQLQIGTSLTGTVAAAYAALWGNYRVVAMASVSMTPPIASLSANQAQVYNAQALDQNSNPIYTAKYHWAANPASLGTFNQTTGTVVKFTSGTTGESGNVWVNATYNGSVVGSHGTVTVTVPVTLSSVSLSPTSPSVGPSSSQPFAATPACSSTCPGTISYVWALTSSKLGTLTGTGSSATFNSGTTAGTVGIYVNATLNSTTKEASTIITVTSAPITLSSVAISPTAPTVGASGSQPFTATPTCSSSCPASGITYVWALSRPTLGTLSGTGASVTFVAGTTAGTVGIFVNATLNSVTKEAFTVITITVITLTSVSLSPAGPTVPGGGQQVFTSTVTCTSTCPSSGISYVWNLTSDTLGTLTGSGSSVTFTAGTTAVTGAIYLNATLGVSKQGASSQITVTAVTLSSVSIAPSGPTVHNGSKQEFTAVTTCSSTCPSSGMTYSWELTSTALGTLTGSGVSVNFTAGDIAGTLAIYINATLGTTTMEAHSPITVTIPVAPITSVTLSPETPSVSMGTGLTFTATPECSGACPTPDITYAWVLTSSAIGSLSGSGQSITFTASSTPATGGIFVNATLNGTTVEGSTVITVTGSTLSMVTLTTPNSFTLPTNGTIQVTADPTCLPECPSAGISYVWALSSTSLGTLTGSGPTVTYNAGNTAGTVGIFVNVSLNGLVKEGSKVITLSPSIQISGLTLDVGTGMITAGSTAIFTATPSCEDFNDNSVTCPSGIVYTWSLSNDDGNLTPTSSASPTTTFTAGNTPGTVEVTLVASLDGGSNQISAQITIKASENSSTTGSQSSTLLLLVIVAVVVVVAVVAVVLLLRRKKGPSHIPPQPYASPPPQGYQGPGQPAGAPPSNPQAPPWSPQP
jgi:hypothetical protein